MSYLGRTTTRIITFATFLYLSIGPTLAKAADNSGDGLFDDSVEKATNITEILLKTVAPAIAGVVWVCFFIAMFLNKTSKEWFIRITVACLGLGSVSALVGYLMA